MQDPRSPEDDFEEQVLMAQRRASNYRGFSLKLQRNRSSSKSSGSEEDNLAAE